MKKVFFFAIVMVLFCCKNREYNSRKQVDCENIKYLMHSCGTGCAMNYEMLSYKKTDASYLIKFKVTMNIYEEVEDVFEIKYKLFCENGESIKFLSVDDSENMLDVNVNSADVSFKKFGDDFCTCLKNQTKKSQK